MPLVHHTPPPPSRKVEENTSLLVDSNTRMPSLPHPHRLLGLSMVAFASFLISIMSACVKFEGSAGSLSSMETVFWRCAISYIYIVVLALFWRVDLVVPREFHWDLTWRCIYGFVTCGTLFWTIKEMTLADAHVLAFTSPILTFFLGAWLLGEAIGAIEFGCAIVSLAGVVCVCQPAFLFGAGDLSASTMNPYAPWGGIVSAILIALTYVHLHKLAELHYVVVTHYFLLTSAAGAGLWVLFIEDKVSGMP
ncbi:hypothetical protein, variant [Aphanomyces invadans]|uniref:EamA domain-containing protein n=1 Tax=Aphanomyces invadans TaxID=157072 RepID=A0A024UHU9_9STRA|nr:hypothetical protein, variant [Aphanomyces invadans]ETW05412.1 hypothetical protein, variant [Aphanomyces invadans]|eukprot:XP_008865189.1 hypothetical protein, variant [Aphanomyces invadans]